MAASNPVIDLQALHGSNRSEALQKLAECLGDYGIFKIKNHGVDPEVRRDCPHEYLQLPEKTGMFKCFNVKKDKVENPRDFRQLHPIEQFGQQWPTHPPCVREYVAEYWRNRIGYEIAWRHIRKLRLTSYTATGNVLLLELS